LRGSTNNIGIEKTLLGSGKEKRRNMSEMLEKILSNENIEKAYKRVYANKGAGGVDGVTIKELEAYMKANWNSIKEQIRMRTYKPQPVLRVEIPKSNGGVRKLGIPTVIDRVIEQAITQVLTPIFDPMFHESSYGFRPNRRCEQAIVKLLELFNGDSETYLKTVTEYRPLKQIRMYTDFENIEEILTECGFKFCNRTIDEKNRRYTRI
jgi:retron-type reverse transcriptase